MLSDAALKDPAMSGQLDYDRVEGDFYATPPENVDCLAHYLDLRGRVVWEPACGEGHISKRLLRYGCQVYSTDLIDRGYGTGGVDFLKATKLPKGCTAIVTNPPYGKMVEIFLRKSLELLAPVDGVCAMFLRNEYDCGSTTRADLFADTFEPYARKIIVTKRPRWIAGSTGSPRHNYSWFVWDFNHQGAATVHCIHPSEAIPITKATTCH